MENSSNENNGNEIEIDLFLHQNKLLFKKYHPIKPIGKGTFSTVYVSINIKTNAYVAIKVEKRSQNNIELLESEAFLLYSIRGFGIPEVLSYGRTKTHNILVLPLLGKSLLDMFIIMNSYVNINDICSVAIQILDRIEWVHSNNIVYRDIKPENFLFGRKDKDVLYLIDFGLCRKYKSSKTGRHIVPKSLGKFTGTSRYASVYAMAGNEQSRRDDIESVGYMIIFFMKKRLPWQGIKGKSYKECYHKLYLMKKYMKIEDLCRRLPNEIIEYMNYAKSLKFEQEPDYKYLKNLFKIILKKNNVRFDKYIYSWCRNDNLNKKDLITNKINNNKLERKSSPQNRLYKKIQESIENKNKSIPNSNLKQIEINDKSKNNTLNSYENSMKNKNEINSETSNTMKVMINKNINSINSGLIESNGIGLPRINSDKNIYNGKMFSFRGNNSKKKYYSPDYKIAHYLTLNPQISDVKNSKEIQENQGNNIKKNNKILVKKVTIPNGNKNRKIIQISPVTNKRNLKNLNSMNTDINNSKGKKLNKITEIKMAKNNTISHNNNSKSKNENIIYNTYNTFNTFNSYNNTIDKSINNNININKIYQRRPEEIHNYQNYERIKKNNLEINNINNVNNINVNKVQNVNINNVNINNVNINNRNNMIKFISPLVEKNAKSLNNIYRGDIINDQIKYSSIDIRANSNTPRDNYKNKQKIINKNNNKKIIFKDNNYFSTPLIENVNKINYNSSNSSRKKKNKIINNIENNITKLKKDLNYLYNSNKMQNVNNLNNPKFFSNIENKIVNDNINYKSIQNINKSNLNDIFSLNNNKNKINNKNIINDQFNINNQINIQNQNIISINNKISNKINKSNTQNKKVLKLDKIKHSFNNNEKGLNNNYSSINITSQTKKNLIPRDIQYPINNNSNSNNQIHTVLPKGQHNNKVLHKKSGTAYIYKNKKPPNTNAIPINRSHISNNSSFNNMSHNQSKSKNEYYNKASNEKSTKNNKPLLIKIEPKLLSNHSIKVVNNSTSLNKTNENILINNNNNNVKLNRFKTEEISVGNQVNRINKYKIIRNKPTQ